MVQMTGRSDWTRAVVFDDERVVANAGRRCWPATLARRLGIEALVDAARAISGDRAGRGEPGPQGDDAGARRWRSARTASMTATCCAAGRTRRCWASGRGAVDAGDVPAGVHVRACPPARPRARPRRWRGRGRRAPAPAMSGWSSTSTLRRRGPRPAKQGAGFGYTHVRGYHPMLATRADTGEVLHIRLRKGSANTRGARCASSTS